MKNIVKKLIEKTDALVCSAARAIYETDTMEHLNSLKAIYSRNGIYEALKYDWLCTTSDARILKSEFSNMCPSEQVSVHISEAIYLNALRNQALK